MRHTQSQRAADEQLLRARIAELEDELRQTRVRLEELDQLYHTAPVGRCLMDRELRFVRINARLADINGLPIKDHIGATLREILPELAGTIEPLLRRVLESGEPIRDLEIQGSTAARPNVVSTYQVSYYPVRNERDEVVGVNTVVQDVTELKEREARLRTLVDHAPEAIVLLDADAGKFVDANENAEKLFGLDRAALLKVGPLELSPAKQPDGRDSRTLVRAGIDQALAGGVPVFEWVHLSAAAEEIPCEIRLVKMPYAGRDLIRGSITDISERIAAQQGLRHAHNELERRVAERTAELAQLEERWRSLVQTAPDIILIVNPDGTIRYINRTQPQFNLSEVIGTSAYDYVHVDHRAAMKACYERVIRTGEVETIEVAVDAPDGSLTWYAARVGPFVENGIVTGATSIATDVTDRRAAEEKLKAEEQFLRQLLELRETERRMLAYDIHDGFVQDVVGAQMRIEGALGLKDIDEIKDALETVSQILRKGIADGRSLIRNLRPMVLDEAGVVEAIRHLAADFQQTSGLAVALAHDVQFDRLEPMLEGAIFRIVQEALNNVKQHARANEAQVELVQRGAKLAITVRDEGRGFDLDDVPRDRFGLRGIRERARVFGGKATIESRADAGTTVRVELPIEG
jgi:PAS domain S-box-containing protein